MARDHKKIEECCKMVMKVMSVYFMEIQRPNL